MKQSDFRAELLRLATALPADGIKGEPVRMVFNTAVVDVDPEVASVTLGDGSIVQGDVVIIADGKNGNTCYRIAISSDEVKDAVGYLPEWWDPETADNRINALQVLDGTNRLVVPYPLRHYDYMNISCLFPTRNDRGGIEESWYADGDRKELISTFVDFYEPIRKILSIAKEVKVWDLQDMDPLPNWHRGRAIVIGDAAHAITPMQGQGANMAMEDADSLRLLLPGMDEDEIKSVLAKVGCGQEWLNCRDEEMTVDLRTRLPSSISHPDTRQAMPRTCASYRYDGEQCLLIDEVHLTEMLMEDSFVTLWDAIFV
ncbi:FAD binding domain protein [Fusarium falciforme]|uniref:FAD binding domain protein n=1 Tax=Fusarium falciforme TaxID=195108 RepID=UPI00230081AF|nr:FAD binding domain protein [Fusarium falciforme]WAO94657.1 FAD binding domain protein [Fusarium falciforme]